MTTGTILVDTSTGGTVAVRHSLDVHSRGTVKVSGSLDELSDDDAFRLAMALLVAGGFDDAETAARAARYA